MVIWIIFFFFLESVIGVCSTRDPFFSFHRRTGCEARGVLRCDGYSLGSYNDTIVAGALGSPELPLEVSLSTLRIVMVTRHANAHTFIDFLPSSRRRNAWTGSALNTKTIECAEALDRSIVRYARKVPMTSFSDHHTRGICSARAD